MSLALVRALTQLVVAYSPAQFVDVNAADLHLTQQGSLVYATWCALQTCDPMTDFDGDARSTVASTCYRGADVP